MRSGGRWWLTGERSMGGQKQSREEESKVEFRNRKLYLREARGERILAIISRGSIEGNGGRSMWWKWKCAGCSQTSISLGGEWE